MCWINWFVSKHRYGLLFIHERYRTKQQPNWERPMVRTNTSVFIVSVEPNRGYFNFWNNASSYHHQLQRRHPLGQHETDSPPSPDNQRTAHDLASWPVSLLPPQGMCGDWDLLNNNERRTRYSCTTHDTPPPPQQLQQQRNYQLLPPPCRHGIVTCPLPPPPPPQHR